MAKQRHEWLSRREIMEQLIRLGIRPWLGMREYVRRYEEDQRMIGRRAV